MLDALSSLFISDKNKAEEKADELFRRYSIDTNKKYGEGGYGATYPAVDTVTKEKLAVKVIDTRRMKLESIVRECDFLTSLDHPNIIKIKAHGLGRKSANEEHLYYIFMELADGGELFDQVIDRGASTMPEDVARGFMLQLVAGVLHCHERGVAHRDLKLENVLLTKAGVVKVIDFGLSYRYPHDANGELDRSLKLKDVCGSKSYAAPEVLGGHGYDGFAADVWSLGVSLFAMLSGFFPLDEASPKDWRYTKLMRAQQLGLSTTVTVFGWYKRTCGHLTSSVVHLLDGMLWMDPARRMTLEQVLVHPWLRPKLEEIDGLAIPPRLLPLPTPKPAPPEAAKAASGSSTGASGANSVRATPVVSTDLIGASLGTVVDQGAYDSRNLIDFGAEDGPAFRCCNPAAPATATSFFPEDSFDDDEGVDVYRSLDLNAELPTLTRQTAFSRRRE